MSVLRVVYVRDHMQAAGGSTYLANTLPLFDPARIKVSLCVLAPRHSEQRTITIDGVHTDHIERAARDPRRMSDLWRVLKHQQPDLLVLSGPRSMSQGRLLGRLLRIPTLVRFNWMYKVTPAHRYFQRALSSPRHRMLAVSNAVRDWAVSGFDVQATDVDVLYPAHDWARYGETTPAVRLHMRRNLDLPEDALVILLVGRLILAEKGQHVIIESLPRILDQFPAAWLVLAGDGPDKARVQALIKTAELTDKVFMLGHREDIPELLCMSDVVVAPSTCDEAFGLVALEAHAASRPVVVSGSGGLAELVTHEHDGLIAGKNDSTALAAAVVRLFRDPELCQKLVSNGLVNASRYSLDQHMEKLTYLLEQRRNNTEMRGKLQK